MLAMKPSFHFYDRNFLLPIIVFLLFILISLPVWTAEVSARLNRATVLEGDTVILSIRGIDLPADEQPDLSPLQQDFDVLGTSSGSQVQITNGQRTDSRYWRVTLLPKQRGAIEIPALTVGAAKTRPMTLTVNEVPQSATVAQGQDVFLEMEVEGDNKPYVQQETRLSVRLLSALPVREGNLGRPQTDAAVIEQLGEEKYYQTKRNGQDYQVVERSYAVFPQKSGELRIPPILFRGSVDVPQQSQRRPRSQSMMEEFFGRDPFANDPFFNGPGFGRMFNRGKPVTVRSNAIELDVQPAPGSVAAGEWLPAENVTLTDSWIGQSMEPAVGVPITRTLTITAKGLSGSQIPALQMPDIPGMRIYSDPVQQESTTDGKTVTGSSSQTFTFVPNQAGQITVPAVTVDWWDTVNNEARKTEVAEVSLDIAAGSLEPVVEPLPDAQQAPSTSQNKTPSNAETTSSAVSTPDETAEDKSYWLWLLIITVLALLTAMIYFLRRQPENKTHPAATREISPAIKPIDTQPLREACLTVCRDNNPRATAQTLLEWVKAEWPGKTPTTLKAVAQQLEAGADEVLSLDRFIYSADSGEWDGTVLVAVLEKGLKRKTEKSKKKPVISLDPLYPTN